MTSAWWAPTLVTPDAPWASGESRAQIILIERTVPHGIMVNRSGQRFCNEAANYSALGGVFHQFDPATYDYLNLPCWLIFDAQYAARYPLGTRQPGQPIPEWVMRADTLAGLAAQIGIDPAALTATVARFNTHADEGHDPDFGRGTSAYDHFYGGPQSHRPRSHPRRDPRGAILRGGDCLGPAWHQWRAADRRAGAHPRA